MFKYLEPLGLYGDNMASKRQIETLLKAARVEFIELTSTGTTRISRREREELARRCRELETELLAA